MLRSWLPACLFPFFFWGVMWVLDLSKFEGSGPYEPACQWVSQVSQCRDHYHLPSPLFSSRSIPHFLFWSLLLSSPLCLCFFFSFRTVLLFFSIRPKEKKKNTNRTYEETNNMFLWCQELWCLVVDAEDLAPLCRLLGNQLPIIPYGSPFKPRRGRARGREK